MENMMQNLMRALSEAQKSIGGIEKDAKNKHHGYNYTSAEAIITDGRTALLRHNVLAKRTSWQINEGANGTWTVTSRFLLMHTESGEHLACESPWPVIPEKGRPFDKALAGALTSSLAYWIRDVLMLPRGMEGEIITDARDDDRAQSEPEPKRQVQERTPERTPDPPTERKSDPAPRDDDGHSTSYIRIMTLMDELEKLEPARGVLDRAEKIPLMAAEAAETNELGRQEEIDIQKRYNPFVRTIREALGVAK